MSSIKNQLTRTNSSRMNTDTLFNNMDIVTEVWKFVTVDSMKKLSNVSKNFNTCYKDMTDIEYISRRYTESVSLGSFILEIGKEVIKEHGYSSSKMLPVLASFFDDVKNPLISVSHKSLFHREVIKSVVEKHTSGIDDNAYLIYYWIVILIHTVNNNYKHIVKTINMIDYKRKTKSKNIIQLFISVFTYSNEQLYGASYSYRKLALMRYISIIHLLMFSKHQHIENKKFQATILNKQDMLIQQIKEFEIFPGRWIYPKTFSNQLIDILQK